MTRQESISEITSKLEEGLEALFQSDKYKEYLNTMSKFHNYSFNNNLLIAMQKPDATYVAGYTSWQKNFDRQVNKGEKAIKIIAPSPYKKIEEKTLFGSDGKPLLGLDGKPLTEKVEHVMQGFKVTSVFDVSQTSGAELPNIVKTLDSSVDGYKDFKEALNRYSPVPINTEKIDGRANGFYSHDTKSITIKEGLSEAQTVKTTVHEVAHSILHDKETGTELNADSRTKEVQAESVAYTVCKHYGIDTSDYSFGYVAGWSSGRDMKELKSSMQTIQETAKNMINGLDKHLDNIRFEKADEMAFKTIDGHLIIQRCDEGYDYTLYNNRFNEIDGGQLDNPTLRIDEAATEALETLDIHTDSLREENIDTLLDNINNNYAYTESTLSNGLSSYR